MNPSFLSNLFILSWWKSFSSCCNILCGVNKIKMECCITMILYWMSTLHQGNTCLADNSNFHQNSI